MSSDKPGMIETLETAAEIISIYAGHTDAPFYKKHRDVAKRLRKIAAYHKPNPLGGPAKVFDIMADRLRAGEKYANVLADYGFRTVKVKHANK